MNELELERSFASGTEAPDHARQFLREQFAGRPRLEDLTLLVSELVTNAVRHGPPGEVLLKIIDGQERTRIEVHQMPRAAPTLNGDKPSHIGFGLKIVEALSDAWGTGDPDWSGVWVEVSSG